MPIPLNKKLYRYLSLDGTGQGNLANVNMTVDGSTTPVEFYVQPPLGESWYIKRLVIGYKDNNGFSADEFASLGTTLTNGIRILAKSGTSEILGDLTGTPDFAIKSNAGWALLAGTANSSLFTWGPGNEFIVAEWDFQADDDSPDGLPGLVLDGTKLQRLSMIIQDNLSAMVGPMGAAIRGHIL